MIDRVKGLLAGDGVRLARHGEVEAQFNQARPWDGGPLPAALQARWPREWQTGQVLTEQIVSLEAERRAVLRTRAEPVVGAGEPHASRSHPHTAQAHEIPNQSLGTMRY